MRTARKKLNEELQLADYVRPVGADEETFVFLLFVAVRPGQDLRPLV